MIEIEYMIQTDRTDEEIKRSSLKISFEEESANLSVHCVLIYHHPKISIHGSMMGSIPLLIHSKKSRWFYPSYHNRPKYRYPSF